MNEEIFCLVKFGIEPMSYNDIYVTTYHGSSQHTFKTNEAKDYEEIIQEILARYFVEERNCEYIKLKEKEFFRLTIEGGIDVFLTKKLTPRRKDCSNWVKVIEDAISRFLGIDDSYNFEVVLRKLDYKRMGKTVPFILMKLEIVTLEDIEKNSEFIKCGGNKNEIL